MMSEDTPARAPLAGYRLVALFAHPDDESYATAATLHRCAREGARVVVITATRGEAAEVAPDARQQQIPDGLGAMRSMELAAACRSLGLEAPRLLNLPDGRLGDIDPGRLRRTIAEAVAIESPQLLITHGSDGAYGHRDHLAVARAALRLPAELGERCPQRILTSEFPRDLFAPVRRALRRRSDLIDRSWWERPLGILPSETAWRLQLDESARQRKLQAIGCHRSQLPDGDPRHFLHPTIVDAVLREESFGVAVGPPLPRDAAHPFIGLEI